VNLSFWKCKTEFIAIVGKNVLIIVRLKTGEYRSKVTKGFQSPRRHFRQNLSPIEVMEKPPTFRFIKKWKKEGKSLVQEMLPIHLSSNFSHIEFSIFRPIWLSSDFNDSLPYLCQKIKNSRHVFVKFLKNISSPLWA